MGEFFVEIFDWVQTLSPIAVYAAVLVISYAENVLPPVPGDMVVVLAGYLAGTGVVDLVPVVILATVGGTLGFMTMYAFGHMIGGAVLDPDRLKWIPKKRIRRARHWIRRWGYGVVAANRFLSGLRSVISLTVGMAHMDAWRTGFWSTLSALAWTSLIGFIGYRVGENWEVVSVWIRQYGQVVGILILVFIVIQVILYRRNVRRNGREEEDVPGDSAGSHFTES